MSEKIIYKNAKGETKYYASYKTAWDACIRLNEKETKGTWLFEGDSVGWYLYFEKDGQK